jgi:hypothetical protein
MTPWRALLVRYFPVRTAAFVPLLLMGPALVALGCKVQCSDPDQHDVMTQDQLLKEQKAKAKSQPDLCEGLRSPKVTMKEEITITAIEKKHVVGHRADLPATEMKRIDTLFVRLKDYRDHYKQLVPGVSWTPIIDVEIDPTIETPRAASLFTTIAFGGYPKIHLRTGDVTLDFTWYVPGPSPDGEPRTALCLDAFPSDLYAIRFEPSRGAPTAPIAENALPNAILAACAGTRKCADVIGIGEGEKQKVIDAAQVARAALSSPIFAPRRPEVVFVTRAPIGTFGAPPGGPEGRLRPCAP